MKFQKVSSIQSISSEEFVYDPCCEAPHSYVANGFVNHNCVLWIDEVEKALSGTKSSNHSDGGTMARVFGTLLTSMEEGLKDVTILATANDLSAMPPEFLRRFDEIFFVDLPGPKEREEIFQIHLRLKNFSNDNLDMKVLVDASENYTGHEIEKAVKRSITRAFRTKTKTLSTEIILAALQDTKPIYDTAHEQLTKMREKAQNRFRYASSWARDQGKLVAAKQKKMDVNDLDLPDMRTDKQTESKIPPVEVSSGDGLQLD